MGLYFVYAIILLLYTDNAFFPCSRLYYTAFIQGFKIHMLLFPRLILDEFYK